MAVAHRTWYARGLTECRLCGGDWYDIQDEPPMFSRLWTPSDDPSDTRMIQSIWAVNCEHCGASYAQINLYTFMHKEAEDR